MRALTFVGPLALLMGVIVAAVAVAYVRGRAGRAEEGPYRVLPDPASGRLHLSAPDGSNVILDGPVKRLVALSTGAEEIIVGLGRAEVLVGVSRFSRDPIYSNIVEDVAAVGDTIVGSIGTSTEHIVRLRPDLVLVTRYNARRSRADLERLGLQVFPLPNPQSFSDIETSIELLGDLLNASTEARRLVGEMRQRLDRVKRERPARAPRIVYLAGPTNLWVAGSGTVIGEVIERAGCRNVAAENGLREFHRVGKELLLNWQPDWIVVDGKGEDDARLVDAFRQDSVLARLKAVVAGRIIVIPARKLTAVSHHVVDAVEILARSVGAESEQ